MRTELRLYRAYVDTMEHLCVFEGSLPLEGKKYNIEWLKRGNRSFLQDRREYLAMKIEELRSNN